MDPTDGHIDDQFLKLANRLDKAYKSLSDNTIEQLKDIFPPHYRYIEDVSKGFSIYCVLKCVLFEIYSLTMSIL